MNYVITILYIQVSFLIGFDFLSFSKVFYHGHSFLKAVFKAELKLQIPRWSFVSEFLFKFEFEALFSCFLFEFEFKVIFLNFFFRIWIRNTFSKFLFKWEVVKEAFYSSKNLEMSLRIPRIRKPRFEFDYE